MVLVSLCISLCAVWFVTSQYLDSMAGNTFGGEVVLFAPPLFIVLLIHVYRFLRNLYLPGEAPKSAADQPALDRRAWAAAIFLFLSTFLYAFVWQGYFGVIVILTLWAACYPLLLKALRNNTAKQIFFWLGLLFFLWVAISVIGAGILLGWWS